MPVPLEDEDEYDTVGGLIYHRIGGVPKPGDQVHARRTDPDRRVDRWAAGGKVLVVRSREESEPEDDEADR